MKKMNESTDLKQENQELKSENSALKNKIAELEALSKWYENQMLLAKKHQFGASSEKTADVHQMSLFDEAENTAAPKAEDVVETETEEITAYKRKKKKGKRGDDLSKLPVVTVVCQLSEEERACQECGELMHKMSEQVRQELELIPATFQVKRYVQEVYSCGNCQENAETTPVLPAKAPEPVIKNSLASPSAVAHIMMEKYVKAVPLYRQEQAFLRDGIQLSRQTMANWVVKCAEDWLDPIYQKLQQSLRQEGVLHADETVLQVLKEPGKKANSNSYQWLYRTSGSAAHPIVLYEYQPTRSSSHPIQFLAGFSGFLHTDGYQAYRKIPDVTVVGCWAHARRKFDEALKVLLANQRTGSNANKGLHYCNQLFALEKNLTVLPPEERYQKRVEKSLPVAEALLAWAKFFQNTVKTPFRTACDYLINQWNYLQNVFLDGRLELSQCHGIA